MKEVKIIVVTHKEYTMPTDKKLYLPVQSGAEIYPELGIQKDNDGDNISYKNPTYNELCPLYWAWKNINADYIGLCHYRRFFSDNSHNGKKYSDILTQSTLDNLLDETSVIVTSAKHYPLSSIQKHYINATKGYAAIHKKDIEILKNVVGKLYPKYLSAFENVMAGNKAHMLNMFIMRRDYFDAYCTFLFDILKHVEEERKDREDKTRFIAALSEFLLDIWLETNHYSYRVLGLVEIEHENIFKKFKRIIKRKFS